MKNLNPFAVPSIDVFPLKMAVRDAQNIVEICAKYPDLIDVGMSHEELLDLNAQLSDAADALHQSHIELPDVAFPVGSEVRVVNTSSPYFGQIGRVKKVTQTRPLIATFGDDGEERHMGYHNEAVTVALVHPYVREMFDVVFNIVIAGHELEYLHLAESKGE